MAASANHSARGRIKASNGNGKENAGGGGGLPVTENSAAEPDLGGLRHNPGISLDWTPEEQSTLEELLTKYASEATIRRFAKIAQALKDKTVRDVAFRCRWMSKKENGKKRKDDNSSSRKNRDKKDKVTDSVPKSSQVANRSNGPPYAQTTMSMDSDDGISYRAIGGAAGQLLEHNAQALDQISANFSACKINENINLFCQARANILSILNDLSDMPEIMKQMPPLPVKLNEELADSILPPPPLLKKS